MTPNAARRTMTPGTAANHGEGKTAEERLDPAQLPPLAGSPQKGRFDMILRSLYVPLHAQGFKN